MSDKLLKYNQFEIESNELGEHFIGEVTDNGVYLNHSWNNGCLFISHDKWEQLDEFREEFLDEINNE